MAVTVETFLAWYPEFSDVGGNAEDPEAVIYRQLMFRDRMTSKTVFGDFRDDAIYKQTAHDRCLRWKPNLSGLKNQAMSGVIASMSAGTDSLSTTNAFSGMVMGNDAFRAYFAKTNYGLDFLAFIDQTVCPFIGAYS